jgi:hypothetical protein
VYARHELVRRVGGLAAWPLQVTLEVHQLLRAKSSVIGIVTKHV